MNRVAVKAFFALMVTAALVACGGGGGSTPSKPNTAPTAAVGAAQTVLAGATVQVSGTGTDADGDVITYALSLIHI